MKNGIEIFYKFAGYLILNLNQTFLTSDFVSVTYQWRNYYVTLFSVDSVLRSGTSNNGSPENDFIMIQMNIFMIFLYYVLL